MLTFASDETTDCEDFPTSKKGGYSQRWWYDDWRNGMDGSWWRGWNSWNWSGHDGGYSYYDEPQDSSTWSAPEALEDEASAVRNALLARQPTMSQLHEQAFCPPKLWQVLASS